MKEIVKRFADEEFGNAVIDWTVLLAGTVMMALAVVLTLSDSVNAVNSNTMEKIEERGTQLDNA